MNTNLIENRQIRIFISSTFRDMMAERDYLVTRVFPSLRRYCEERDVTLFELDLRWGISEEESKQGKVVDICLKEIQNTRPFFIGLLGDRYGWTPNTGEQEVIAKNTSVLEDYPWVKGELESGTSITEIEIQEGVLKSDKKMNAYFYLRSVEMEVPDTDEFRERAESPAAEKLQILKSKIREQKEYPVKDYASIDELGQFVEKDFKELVDSLFPEGAISELEKERLEQRNFLKSKTGVYIPIPGYENKIDDFIGGSEKALVVTAPHGMGKSAFLADWIVKRQKDPVEGLTIMYHFIGVSRSEGDYHKITQRLIDEVTDIYGIINKADTVNMSADALNENKGKDEDAQTKILQDLLFAIPPEQKLVIILDGVDKLDEANNAKLLNWLPAYPENVKFIFSTLKEDVTMDYFRRREYVVITIEALNIKCRKRLITDYLLSFGKHLSSAQVERIAKDNESENPLVLRALIDEIRIFGVFEKLDAEIDRYLTADSIPAFFALILGRLEDSFKSADKNIVKDILSLICVSRNGLAEEEILELSGAAPLYWSQIYNVLSGHLSVQNGLVSFAHPFIQDAVKCAWLNTKEAENSYRKKIAGYMKTENVWRDYAESAERSALIRRKREYPFQLYKLQDWDTLYDFLLDLVVFFYLYGMDKYELGKYWRSLKEVDSNKYSLKKYLDINAADIAAMDEDKEVLGFVYKQLGEFSLVIIADWELFLEFNQKALAIREEVLGKNHRETAHSYNDIGDAYSIYMGDYPKALEFNQKALAIREEVLGKNHRETAHSYNDIGDVYRRMSDYPKALEFCQKSLIICEEIFGKNHPATADSYNAIGNVYNNMSDYPKALEFRQKALVIHEEVLGKNHRETARSYNDIGDVYNNMSDYPKALEFHQKALAIREEIIEKNSPFIAISYNAIGNVYNNMSDYPKALEFHQKDMAIREEVYGKKHSGTATSYNNIGSVYNKSGDYPKALEFYQKALAIHEEVLGKNHADTATSYNNIGSVYNKSGDYLKALEFHQKALTVHEEVLGKNHLTTAASYYNIGFAYSNMGDYPKALEFYQKALPVWEESFEKNHSNTITCYNNIGDTYKNLKDYPKALEFYQKALAVREEVLGKNHADTAISYSNIGSVYNKSGDYPKALGFHQKALAVREEVLGKNHTDTAVSYYNIGIAYYMLGDNPNALEFYQKALPVWEESFGKDHSNTIACYEKIGLVYHKLGDFPKEQEFYQKAGRQPPGKKHTEPLSQKEIDMLLAAITSTPNEKELHQIDMLLTGIWPPGKKHTEILSQEEINLLLATITSTPNEKESHQNDSADHRPPGEKGSDGALSQEEINMLLTGIDPSAQAK